MNGPSPCPSPAELALEYHPNVDVPGELAISWQQICEVLQGHVGKSAFDRWFAPMRILVLDGVTIRLRVPNMMHQYWVETNFLAVLNGAIAEVMDGSRVVEFVPDSDDTPVTRDKLSPRREQKLGAMPATSHDDLKFSRHLMDCGLKSQFTFSSFVQGPNCRYSYAVAKTVAEKPGKVYNPLFLHGDVGIGKTHLMQAIGQEIIRSKPNKQVRYITSETFTNEYIEAVRKANVNSFRNKFRRVDVLLVDDVQFFSGKDSTQEEFFHTFNDLFNLQKQIVVTSDRAPSSIKDLENRLVSRFESGLTTHIEYPDLETRIAILRQKMTEWTVSIDDWVLTFLADHISTNVRRLEGALMRVAAFISVGGAPLTESSLSTFLKDVLEDGSQHAISIDRIQKIVAEYFDIRMSDITGHRRLKTVVLPRQIAMYLSRLLTTSSLKAIGEAFGGKDHGTVIHAVRTTETKVAKEEEIRRIVSALTDKIKRSNS